MLIISGDLTARHTPIETVEFLSWLSEQKYKKIIWIAGNHDTQLVEEDEYKGFFDAKIFDIEWPNYIEYLCDSGTEFSYEEDNIELEECGMHPTEEKTLKIWGSPWTKTFPGMNPHCMAFTYYDENWFYDEKVAKIPVDVDILITHSPPYSILDKVTDGYSVGSLSIYNWLKYVGRPRLHVFGHIHEAYGQCEYFPTYDDKMMISVNASIMNEDYQPVNKPVRVIL